MPIIRYGQRYRLLRICKAVGGRAPNQSRTWVERCNHDTGREEEGQFKSAFLTPMHLTFPTPSTALNRNLNCITQHGNIPLTWIILRHRLVWRWR